MAGKLHRKDNQNSSGGKMSDRPGKNFQLTPGRGK